MTNGSPAITFADRLELSRCLQEAEAIASAWHRRDGDSVAAPKIAFLLGEARRELALETGPAAAGRSPTRPAD